MNLEDAHRIVDACEVVQEAVATLERAKQSARGHDPMGHAALRRDEATIDLAKAIVALVRSAADR